MQRAPRGAHPTGVTLLLCAVIVGFWIADFADSWRGNAVRRARRRRARRQLRQQPRPALPRAYVVL
jgi:hypothetical protein